MATRGTSLLPGMNPSLVWARQGKLAQTNISLINFFLESIIVSDHPGIYTLVCCRSLDSWDSSPALEDSAAESFDTIDSTAAAAAALWDETEVASS